MTKEQKGKYAELLVLARLIKDGKTIAVPFGNQSGWARRPPAASWMVGRGMKCRRGHDDSRIKIFKSVC